MVLRHILAATRVEQQGRLVFPERQPQITSSNGMR